MKRGIELYKSFVKASEVIKYTAYDKQTLQFKIDAPEFYREEKNMLSNLKSIMEGGDKEAAKKAMGGMRMKMVKP
jgi:hypothetical protein